MSFSAISGIGASVTVAKEAAPSFKGKKYSVPAIPLFRHRAPTDDSLFILTDRSISVVSPSKHRDSAPSRILRSTSPVLLNYVAEEDRAAGVSSEHEGDHALNFSQQVSAALKEGKVKQALVKVSMISIPSMRITVECEIFEQVLALAEKYPKDSAEFKEYEEIAWTALNRAFDFLKEAKADLAPEAYRELEDRLIRLAKE